MATLEAERKKLRDEMKTIRTVGEVNIHSSPCTVTWLTARNQAAQRADAEKLNEEQRMQKHIAVLHAEIAALQANLDDVRCSSSCLLHRDMQLISYTQASRREISHEEEKKDMEVTLAELRSQREKSDARTVTLKEVSSIVPPSTPATPV